MEWRDIPKWEGIYKASTEGDICSIDRVLPNGRRVKGHLLKPLKLQSGHGVMVDLCWGGEKERGMVARFIWRTFRGDIPDGYVVTYKDGNNLNTRLENLALIEANTITKRMSVGNTKVPKREHKQIIALFLKGQSTYKIAKRYEVNPSTIQSILTKHRMFRRKRVTNEQA